MREMLSYDWWIRKCAEADEAFAEQRKALDAVILKMKPGGGGVPSEAELDALDAARKRFNAIRNELDNCIAKDFGRS
jgi:hypothetical protein